MAKSLPILITGSHRSGTTWVGKTLARAHGVEYIHEPFNLSSPNPRMGPLVDNWFEDYHSSRRQDDISHAFDCLLDTSLGRQSGQCRKFNHFSRKTINEIRNQGLWEKLVRSFGGHRMLVKDPLALFSAEWLNESYGFQVVCMIRSPLAFIASLKKRDWDFDFCHLSRQERLMDEVLSHYKREIEQASRGAGDFIDRGCLLWNVLHYRISQYQNAHEDWTFIRHEQLAMEPLIGFKDIFAAVGLKLTPRIRKIIRAETSATNPAETESIHFGPRAASETTKLWKSILNDEEAQRVEDRTAAVDRLLLR